MLCTQVLRRLTRGIEHTPPWSVRRVRLRAHGGHHGLGAFPMRAAHLPGRRGQDARDVLEARGIVLRFSPGMAHKSRRPQSLYTTHTHLIGRRSLQFAHLYMMCCVSCRENTCCFVEN